MRLISKHGLILLYVAQHPRATYREIGRVIGITERHAVRLVRDLEASGVLHYKRDGANKVYTIRLDAPLPDPIRSGVSVREMIAVLTQLAADSSPDG